jgi:hypothetical protein
MTLAFQIIAVLIIGIAGLLLVRGSGQGHQALRRLMMALFIAAAATSVFFPESWTWVANRVGVGRGTDLLLYLLVLVFIGFVATTYRRFRYLEDKITQLSREFALDNAERPRESPKKSPRKRT